LANIPEGTAPNAESVENKLYSAVIADILDDHGYRNQVMDSSIRPIAPSFKLMGRAFTVLATDVYEMPDNPYENELAAVDSLSRGDVLVATTNGSTSCGFWGELLSTAARSKGAHGAIVDGFTRDSSRIVEMNFPVFVRGYSPLDSKGRLDVISYGRPIRCGGIEVQTGDLMFADHDGIVVIPASLVSQVLPKALEKVAGEDGMRHALKRGVGVVEAYREHGIL
jgi:regulator of RNase E activity RraA